MHKHDKHHMQSNSDMIWPISYCSFDLHLRAPWSSSSPAWHHDLHHHDLHHRVFMKLSRQRLLLLLWLTRLAIKWSNLHGVIQWLAGHTKNKDNSYGSCRLSYSSTCKSWFLLQEYDQSHTSHISFITSSGHITSQGTCCKNKLDVL